ncbi:hypothetical protein Bca101_100537 [Brassica carinata]
MGFRLNLPSRILLLHLTLLSVTTWSESARVFTIVNSCDQTIWPAITPGENFSGGGFKLKPGHSIVFKAPVDWSGRIWGRTGCKFDKTGTGSCETGSCGSNLKCSTSGKQPASLAEFTLSSVDFYDVSLVDGFNLPMTVNPVNGTGNCTVAGCVADLTLRCPAELAVKSKGRVISFYGNPSTCRPTHYSKIFKKACPTAYSYAYDDPTSIFTCSGSDYVISFCSYRKKPVGT